MKAPPNAVAYRPYLEQFRRCRGDGGGGLLAHRRYRCAAAPARDAGRGAADFCAGGHRGRTRLDRIEQGLQSPVSITYATLAAARADNVSATVSTLEIRGGSFAGDGTRQTYRRATPAAAAAAPAFFISADGAYWARVDGQTKLPDLGQTPETDRLQAPRHLHGWLGRQFPSLVSAPRSANTS